MYTPVLNEFPIWSDSTPYLAVGLILLWGLIKGRPQVGMNGTDKGPVHKSE